MTTSVIFLCILLPLTIIVLATICILACVISGVIGGTIWIAKKLRIK